ncbi:CatB-related O-acetyltransferase [Roseovarius aquimarinus]|uniref:CatB-related O-acetyltransferase n=1 Tax=Roseovarius aquimarinus TaxID=1229156 RepID=A0ABW7I610_9RHOB
MKTYIPKKTFIEADAVLEAPVRFFGACRVREKCSIGRFTFINDRTTLFPGTSVGRYCSIGKGCEIGAPTHPDDWLTSSPVAFAIERHFPNERDLFAQQPFEQYRPVVIGSDVWIGSLAIVFGGVSIGHGAIIGGGAVVTEDVPPYAVVVGAPARLHRYRFDEATVARLLAAEWWTRDPEEIGALDFRDVEGALNRLEAAR